ncbi:MAG: E3 binding domain-containing protein, partial [Rubrobacteraceae bacterium]
EGEVDQVAEEQGAGQAMGGESPGEAAESGSEEEEEQAPPATNAALRKAKELGVDLSGIQGTGANGLITVKDVVRA